MKNLALALFSFLLIQCQTDSNSQAESAEVTIYNKGEGYTLEGDHVITSSGDTLIADVATGLDLGKSYLFESKKGAKLKLTQTNLSDLSIEYATQESPVRIEASLGVQERANALQMQTPLGNVLVQTFHFTYEGCNLILMLGKSKQWNPALSDSSRVLNIMDLDECLPNSKQEFLGTYTTTY